MGYSLNEAHLMTFNEFNFLNYGRLMRSERQWEHTREVMASIVSFGGMGSKKVYAGKDILKLTTDKHVETPKVTTIKQAEAIFKQLIN